MKKIKVILLVFVITAMSATMLSGLSPVTANDEISVTLDGTKIDFDVNPQIVDGRTVVPLRRIFEEIGALVKWDAETQTVSARKNSKTVTMTIGSADMQIDKGKTDEEGNAIIETVTLDVPSQILDGRTLVPARAISEAFGLNVDWDDETNTVIITDEEISDDTWKENTGTINLTDLTYTGDGIEITDNQIKITEGGDYTLKGTLADGNITVSTKDKVKIRLSGASVTSDTGSCIYFEEADKAYITITDGTENSLTALDSESAAIYSKDNLEIKGDGSLDITANGGHAIKASDNLTIENGIISLTSEGDGIHVNDTFKMTGGKIDISATGDGIDSESIVIIQGGELNIVTKGVPVAEEANTEESTDNSRQNIRFNAFFDEADVEFEKSSKGINAEWMLSVSGGSITVSSASHAIHCSDEIEITGGVFNISSTYDKGISAHGNLTIDGNDTVIDITKSTEGLESKNIMTINDGTIDIVASDDAINATGGKSGDMTGGFGGGSQKNCLVINGGDIEVIAGDDCLDSNGNILITGGIIKATKVNGSFVGTESVIDPDGSTTIGEDATIIAAVASGGLQGNLNISQNTITLYSETNHSSGDKITLTDKNGKAIAEYTPNGAFKAVIIISPDIEAGEAYTLTVGDESNEITVTDKNTVIGTQSTQGGFGNRIK